MTMKENVSDKLLNYQIITPTAWNASPRDVHGVRGPWEEALVGTKIKDVDHPIGHPFFYFTYSAAVSEVEVDVLTGQFNIRRSDILYDTGKSLNPTIDVGQVEGAFVQGIGYLTSEEVIVDKNGVLLSDRPWNYKPPFSKDIPIDFRVTLKKSKQQTASENTRPGNAAVKSSKGIGEPPFVLALSVFFAIKQAVMAARKERDLDPWFEMDAPATVRKIKEHCGVQLDQMKL